MKKKRKQSKICNNAKGNIPTQRGKYVIGKRPDGTLFHEAFFGNTTEEVEKRIDEFMESLNHQ
ncbi:hypothetical protein [Gudongella sp. DL1XJH-153]|uniref:hypothetical protein n=1 Tax=Gudongella sp. DL1XJH-153 TaxID=3409804 RepID=UPI003BB65C79